MMKKTYASVLTVAGSDCSGGAGIQADIKTISALGCYAASAITAITVQNTCGVSAIHPVPSYYITGQIDAVMSDISPKAVKIGMIHSAETARIIASSLKKFSPKFIVFDPVMISTSGCKLIEDSAIEAITREIMPMLTLITPNLYEAETLTGVQICSVESMQTAANELLKYGSEAVLIKGGHLKSNIMYDLLQIKGEQEPHIFKAPHIESNNTHGTGCTLSSAIASFLSLGETLEKAVEKAKAYVYQCIDCGKDVCIGKGHGPLNHFHSPVKMHIFTENE